MAIPYKLRSLTMGTPTDQVPPQLENMYGSGLSHKMVCVDNVWEQVKGLSDVKQSMFVCVATPITRRLMQPDYGSVLPILPFEPAIADTFRLIKNSVKDALKAWVPEIICTDVACQQDTSNAQAIQVTIIFQLKGTTSKQTLSLVLFNQEGVQISPDEFLAGNTSYAGVI